MRRAGFTLVELALVLLVVSLLLSGLAMPLAAQVAQRRQEETLRLLDEAREAVLAFAVVHGRLPCPAVEASGVEAFAAGAGAASGRCADFHGGFLPAATLGLAGLDAHGHLRDAWGTPANRIRYAVAAPAVNGIPDVLTRTHGMQAASIGGLAAEPHYLYVCAVGSQASASGCGPAAHQLTRRAAFVLVSAGANAVAGAPGRDEARNADGDGVFVHRPPASGADPFDDLLHWAPIHLVVSRMVSAGRLP